MSRMPQQEAALITRKALSGLGASASQRKAINVRTRRQEVIFVRFQNGWGASISRNSWSYGGLELAVLDRKGKLSYDTPVTYDVIGHIASEKELGGYLRQIRDLPRDNRQRNFPPKRSIRNPHVVFE